MKRDASLDVEVERTLTAVLGTAVGRYPAWGSSPQSQSVHERTGSRPMHTLMARPRIAIASLVVVLAVGASGVLLATRGIGAPSPAGGNSVNIWAVAALSDTELIAVGGSDDASGGLVLAKTTDAGLTWTVTQPNGPALSTLAAAGGRLLGATDCAAQYAGTGPSAGLAVPQSCLYESADGGATWVDLHQGRIVDPTFADASHGFAHSPLDTVGASSSILYTTSDGGHTWKETTSPCGPETPGLAQSVAVSPTTVAALCVGAVSGATPGGWEIVRLSMGSAPTVLARPGMGGIGTDVSIFRFSMRANGQGLLFGDQVFRSTDNGATWAVSESPDARVAGGCFTAAGIGYFAIRDSGRFTAIVKTEDAGSTWHELARWPFFGH